MTEIPNFYSDILFTIGFIITAAFLGSKMFQRLGIPQVVGFIVMGVLMGSSFLNVVLLELVEELDFQQVHGCLVPGSRVQH